MLDKISFILRLFISKFHPIIKNTIFFDSFHGQYNDNPKYISEYIHSIAPDISLVWSKKRGSTSVFPDYVKTVEYNSKDFFKYSLNSEIVVDNHMGLRTLGFKLTHFKLIDRFLKKRGQLCIATWHGTPLKKIGKDQISRNTNYFYTSIDYCVSGCEYTQKYVGNAFFLEDNRMKLYGTPRNDVFFKQSNINELKIKLNLPLDKSIILFAPTFRKSVEMSGLNQLQELNIPELLNSLEKRFEKEFVFVFRAHHSVITALAENQAVDFSHLIIDGNIGDDMAEYLLCCDVLLTDYSSSLYDFFLTKKPCFLYAPDLDYYKNIERGFYSDTDLLPISFACNSSDLYNSIVSFDYDKYIEKTTNFLKTLGNVEDGLASQRVSEDILSHLSQNK